MHNLPPVYRKRELRCRKMSTIGNKFAIFQYQFTSTVYWTSSVLLNSRNQSAWWRQLHTSWRAKSSDRV